MGVSIREFPLETWINLIVMMSYIWISLWWKQLYIIIFCIIIHSTTINAIFQCVTFTRLGGVHDKWPKMHASKKLTKTLAGNTTMRDMYILNLAGNTTMRDMYILNLLNVHSWTVTYQDHWSSLYLQWTLSFWKRDVLCYNNWVCSLGNVH